MGDIFTATCLSGPSPTAYDEVVGTSGTLRPQYEEVASALSAMSAVGIPLAPADRLARAFRHQGVTFDLDGEERPFPVDVVPRVFTTAEWDVVEAEVRQRGTRTRSFPRRRLRTRSHPRGRRDAGAVHHELAAFFASGSRGQPDQRGEG